MKNPEAEIRKHWVKVSGTWNTQKSRTVRTVIKEEEALLMVGEWEWNAWTDLWIKGGGLILDL